MGNGRHVLLQPNQRSWIVSGYVNKLYPVCNLMLFTWQTLPRCTPTDYDVSLHINIPQMHTYWLWRKPPHHTTTGLVPPADNYKQTSYLKGCDHWKLSTASSCDLVVKRDKLSSSTDYTITMKVGNVGRGTNNNHPNMAYCTRTYDKHTPLPSFLHPSSNTYTFMYMHLFSYPDQGSH